MTSTAVARAGEVHSAPVQGSPVPPDFALVPMIDKNRALLTAKLPHGFSLEQMMVELYLASQKDPSLLNVKADDLVPALCEALDTGGTIGKDVYLLTFYSSRKSKTEVAVALNYQFKAELVVRAGGARSIDAAAVYSKEPFDYQLGTSPGLKHKKLPPSTRGSIIGAYAVAQMGHGIVKVEYVDIESIEAIRKTSKQWNPEKAGQVCPEWYACKTVVHRLVKLLPKNPKLTRLLGRIDAEERIEFGDPDQIEAVDTTAAHAPASSPTPSSFDISTDLDEDESEPKPDVAGGELTVTEAVKIEVQRRPLGTLRNGALRKVQEEARIQVDKEGESSKYVKLLVAIRLILEARERGELVEPSSKTA
jgi:recombination protein RecT